MSAATKPGYDVATLSASSIRDGPSATYLRRCEQYLLTPPPSDWDGVFELDSK